MGTVLITAKARKGAAHRQLHRVVAKELERIQQPELRARVQLARAAANQVITHTARGDELAIQLLVQEGPRGDWSVSVSVNIEPAGEGRA